VRHEVVALPRLGQQVALARLPVAVRARDAPAGQPALDGRALLDLGRGGGLAQPAVIEGS
jgi:hypothetical protein